jgi:diguanylate cyclase (GGDEF)-like protein
VRTLSPADAKKALPVALHGTVTYVDLGSGQGQLFIQDETAGIFVFTTGIRITGLAANGVLHKGQLVEVKGVTTQGGYSPCVEKAEIRVVGQGTIPIPKALFFDRFLATREDGQWAELEGVVRSGQIKSGRLFLNVAAFGGSFLAIQPYFRSDWKETLVDSVVSVKGVLAPIRNTTRQAVGVRMFVPEAADISIEEAAPADPFDRPATGMARIGEFRPQEELERRIRVRATVSAMEQGPIYVSDGEAGLAVQSQQTCAVQPGELVDVVGFPGPVEGHPGLQESLCRRVTEAGITGMTPVPLAVTPDDILPPSGFTDPSGVGQASGTRFDLKLIRIEGTVLQIAQSAGDYVLSLSSGGSQFTATIPSGSAPPQLKEPGSLVQITGVCVINYDRYNRGQSFRILMRTPGDVVLKTSPPWWNPQRTMWGFGIMTVAILLFASWIASLRRQVSRRTQELQQANESLGRLSRQDPLTGTANRRQFDATLKTELLLARRSRSPLSLLLVDIDHFKVLNDSFGHLRGDESLVVVGQAMRSALRRPSDLLARYGGEEFAVILPETNAHGAIRIAEAIRTAVAGLEISNPVSDTEAGLTISVGVATTGAAFWLEHESGEGATPANLIASADQALYRAKALGRNQCVSSEP